MANNGQIRPCGKGDPVQLDIAERRDREDRGRLVTVGGQLGHVERRRLTG